MYTLECIPFRHPMIALLVITIATCLASLAVDSRKTALGLKKAVKKAANIFLPFAWTVILVSVSLALFSEKALMTLLTGETTVGPTITALLSGSVLMLPGAIAFPLGGLFLENGASPGVIAGFTSSLMMVGILTLGIEKQYLGTRVAIIRNSIGLITAALVALITGWVLG